VISADAVDPGVNLGRIEIEAGVELGTSLGNAFGFPSGTGLALGLGLGPWLRGVVVWARNRVHGCNLAIIVTTCQGRRHFRRRRAWQTMAHACPSADKPRARFPVKFLSRSILAVSA
jgi:hypothetical protein